MRIEVTLALGRKEGQEARIGLRAGGNKLYVVKDLQAFLTAMKDGKPVTFGKDFIYEPDWMHFSGEDERVFNLLRKLFSAQAENGKDKNGRMVPMPDPFVKELLEEIGETPLRIMDRDGGIIRCRQIRQAKLPLQFTLNMGPRGLNASARMPADFLPVTADCAWAMTGGRLIETDRSQRELIRMIWRHQYEGRCLFQYPLDQTGRVISEVLPYLKSRLDREDSVNPNQEWQVAVPVTTLVQKLRSEGYNIGTLKRIEISPLDIQSPKPSKDRYTSCRVKTVRFVGSVKTVEVPGTKLRWIFGLHSTLFDIRYGSGKSIKPNKDGKIEIKNRSGETITFDGAGWGHGLGLSQWGARGMAAKHGYRDILARYYTDVKIEKLF